MYKVISINNLFGEKVNLDRYNINFVGDGFVLATLKGYGRCFMARFDRSNGYTVITEKV